MNTLSKVGDHRGLARYTARESLRTDEPKLRLLSVLTVAACLAAGALLSLADVVQPPVPVAARIHRVTVETAPVSLPGAPEPAPAPAPPRLEPATILAAPVDRPRPAPQPVAVPTPVPADAPARPVRRVYGVRKVYARGLGTGAGGAPGLVVKHGNTVDGRADTLTATSADLRGELAALSTVEQAPGPLHRVKPRYSEALIAARARGTVTAYLLVDVDGSVRDVNVTEDIGHDSRAVAEAAFRQFRFSPALKGGEPVAVWILHRIRFEFQE